MQYALLWIYGFAPLYAFWVKYLWREYNISNTDRVFGYRIEPNDQKQL